MNLTELLDYISTNPDTIAVQTTGDPDTSTQIIRRIIFKINDITADSKAVVIVIKDPSLPSEEALIIGYVPPYLRITTFQDEVTTAIENYKTTHPELEYYKFEFVDEANEVAKVLGYEYDSGQQLLTETPYMLYKVNDSLQFRKINTA